MSVHQLKDGRWIVQYPNPSPPPRLLREYFGRGATAQVRAEQREKTLATKQPKHEGPIFTEIAGEYLESRDFNENSKNLLALRLKANILPILGGLQAVRMTHNDLDRYIITAERPSHPVRSGANLSISRRFSTGR